MSFYLFLPSNVSPRYFPENRISRFKTKLPKWLKFKPDEYEVALMEISYVHCMKTFPKAGDRKIGYNDIIQKSMWIKKPWETIEDIPNKNYSTVQVLCDELNTKFKRPDGTAAATFRHNLVTNRVVINAGTEDGDGEVVLSEKLSDSLGFDAKHYGNFMEKHIGEFPPDINGGMYHLFVYCDFVQPQVVGNTQVPLLRIVNITGKEGEAVTQTFRPYYLPVSKLEFDTIEVLLCNEFGEEIEFDRGNSVITVHFRPKEKYMPSDNGH